MILAEKCVRTLYAVLPTIEQSRDLKVLVRRYEHNEDIQAACIHMLPVLETELYGSSGLLACMEYINSRTFPSKQDPSSLFAEMRTHWVSANRMSLKARMYPMLMSSVVV